MTDNPKEPIGCRYIFGHVGEDWRYCQKEQREGSPYCPEHHAKCYIPKSAIDDKGAA